MIIRQDKGYEKSEAFPNSNPYENESDNYVVDETTEEGQALSAKIIGLYPYYNFILDVDGKLIDVEAYTPTPEEVEANKPPKSKEEIQAEKIAALEAENTYLKAQSAQQNADFAAFTDFFFENFPNLS